ncbi:unnamed protein product [Rhizophagus irregularis]|nr:unnamed protein product [Rhizophagus irregularis]
MKNYPSWFGQTGRSDGYFSLLGHNISDGLFFFCIFRCVEIQFRFFLFLDGLLVSFDIALQIFFRWLGFEYLNLTASFSSSHCTRRLLQVFGSLDMTFRQLFQTFFDADSWDNRKRVGLDGPGHARFW